MTKEGEEIGGLAEMVMHAESADAMCWSWSSMKMKFAVHVAVVRRKKLDVLCNIYHGRTFNSPLNSVSTL